MRLSLMLCQTLLLLAVGCTSKPNTDPIVIGLLAPMSGPGQDIGKSMEQGVLLAVEETKDKPIDGRPVSVLVVDTAGNAESAFHQAVRLVTINRVAALIGGHDTATAEKLCRVGETYQLPVVTPVWLPARGLGPFGFSVGLAPADRGKALGKLAVQAGERVAVLTDSRDAAAPVLTAAFVAQLKPEEVALQALFDDRTAADVIKQVGTANAQAALIAGPSVNLARWRDLKLPILFGGEFDLSAVDEEMGTWTSAYVPAEASGQDFAAKFTKRFGKPPDAAAALANDAARLWIESVRKVGMPHGLKTREEMGQWKDFSSTTGPLSIDEEHAAHRPVFVLRRDQGAAKPIGVWKPESK